MKVQQRAKVLEKVDIQLQKFCKRNTEQYQILLEQASKQTIVELKLTLQKLERKNYTSQDLYKLFRDEEEYRMTPMSAQSHNKRHHYGYEQIEILNKIRQTSQKADVKDVSYYALKEFDTPWQQAKLPIKPGTTIEIDFETGEVKSNGEAYKPITGARYFWKYGSNAEEKQNMLPANVFESLF